MKRTNARTGFSLVEALVASVILSGVVVTVGAIGSRALVATRQDSQYERGAALLDRQLTMIDHMGVAAFIQSGQTEGDFGELAPGYRWRVVTRYLEVDQLYQVTIAVIWVDRSRPKQLVVVTRLNDTGGLLL